MPGLCKIGATRKHPIQRATELSAGTGVPGMFSVVYWLSFEDCFEAESILHERFAVQRVDSQREFFAVEPQDVIHSMQVLASQLPSSGNEGGEWIDNNGSLWPAGKISALPWSELFISFPDDGSPRELTEEESRKCHELSIRLGH